MAENTSTFTGAAADGTALTAVYLTQPAADLLTILVCLCSIRSMKRIASANMNRTPEGG